MPGPPVPPRHRPALPVFPAPETGGGFPVVASLAPVAAAAVIFAVTRSPFALLFAAAAPLAALGGLLDRRIRRRRADRRALATIGRALDRVEHEVEEAHVGVRAAEEARAPDPARLASGSLAAAWTGGAPVLRVGCADLPSDLELGRPENVPRALERRVGELIGRAATVPGVPVAIEDPTVGVVGPEPMRSSAMRALVLQICAAVPPEGSVLRAPDAETWVQELPHPLGPATGSRGYELASVGTTHRVVGAAMEADLPPGVEAVIRIDDGDGASLTSRGAPVAASRLEVALVSAGTAAAAASRLREAAVLPAGGPIPDRVALSALPASPGSRVGPPGGLWAPIGADGGGPVGVDLVHDGPHAVIGGTTGSGKSELLIAWVLALAERHLPSEVSFLLIDFKGGASFAPLVGLTHVVGVVSDLDASTARRAVSSLRSEVLRRESLLADAGVRELAQLPGTPRLVVVIDEYAALVSEQPELHETVADLASRGRSLGIHLVLCTQRPGGVVREQVLANAGLRICLRVNNRSDSLAVIGTDQASLLSGAPAGRGLVLGSDGRTRRLQCALAEPSDVARIVAASAGTESPFRPWAEPLPGVVRADRLEAPREGVAFGVVDLPEQQRLAVAGWAAEREGNLLVVGGRGAGTTTALRTLSHGLGQRSAWVPGGVADAWSVLAGELADGAAQDGRIVVVDDVDLLLDAADDEDRAGLLRLLAALARELPARRGALVLGASRIPAAASALLSRVDARLLLGMPDREQHVLAGGEARDWIPRRPPGRGWWHGREVQVAVVDGVPTPVAARVPDHAIDPALPLAVVAGDADRVSRRLRALGLEVGDPSDGPEVGRAAVGDPEEWQAAWSALEVARREADLLVVGCAASDLRTLLRTRADVPPLDRRRPEGWRMRLRRPERVRIPWLEAERVRDEPV